MGPGTRFGAAKGVFTDHGIRGFRTAMAAQGDTLTDDEAKVIDALWYNRRIPTEADLPLIERVEAVAQRIQGANKPAHARP